MIRTRSSLIVEIVVLVSRVTGIPVDQITEQTQLGEHAECIVNMANLSFGRSARCTPGMTFGDLRTQLVGP